MKNGFVKVAAVTPELRPADVNFNVEKIIEAIEEASKKKAKIIVFPELAITGKTCGDLFLSPALIKAAAKGLEKIEKASEKTDALIFVGLPFEVKGKVYNAAAAINRGSVLGITGKTYTLNLMDKRYFTECGSLFNSLAGEDTCRWHYQDLPFGNRILYRCSEMEDLVVACEIGSDFSAAVSPGTLASMAGATVIVNPAGSRVTPGSTDRKDRSIISASWKNICAYITAGSGIGESTADQIYAGFSMAAECGRALVFKGKYTNEIIYTDVDVELVKYNRNKKKTFETIKDDEYWGVDFSLDMEETVFDRKFSYKPFIPSDEQKAFGYCEEVLDIQARALAERLKRIHCEKVVIGVSGGLDSTLALIAAIRAFDHMGLPRTNIEAVSMPGFGTTGRTSSNAEILVWLMGAKFRLINIGESVKKHFEDIGHDASVMNAAYENSQARERTQILMDIANDIGGIVVGTGDLSELALGWATYNGDHMSMYGINATIPKTFVRVLVKHYADTCDNARLKKTLYDIIDTPVSPELIPGKEDGKIGQKTEELVGPYEIHDFVLYYSQVCGYTPEKILRIAAETMKDVYDRETISKWMKNFFRRFFSQQFKRSCMPEGPQAGPVNLSPRGGYVFPSDAQSSVWLEELN